MESDGGRGCRSGLRSKAGGGFRVQWGVFVRLFSVAPSLAVARAGGPGRQRRSEHATRATGAMSRCLSFCAQSRKRMMTIYVRVSSFREIENRSCVVCNCAPHSAGCAAAAAHGPPARSRCSAPGTAKQRERPPHVRRRVIIHAPTTGLSLSSLSYRITHRVSLCCIHAD